MPNINAINDAETKIIKESKSNYTLEVFAFLCLSALAIVFILCCNQIAYKDVSFLDSIDISKIDVVAIGTSVSIPLALILLVDIVLPQKLIFDRNGITKYTAGMKSFMAWNEVSEVNFKESSLGQNGDAKLTLVVIGKESTMNIMPVFELSQNDLANYIMRCAAHEPASRSITQSRLPAKKHSISKKRKDINKNILVPSLIFLVILVALGFAIFFSEIYAVVNR